MTDKSYVYEDIQLPNGWTAMIEIVDIGDLFILGGFMACSADGMDCSTYNDDTDGMTKDARQRAREIAAMCGEWLRRIMEDGTVADHHADYRRKLAARRRLIADVEATRATDPAITGQTAELVRRPIVSLADELLRGERRRFDDTNHDSADADWRDEIRHG